MRGLSRHVAARIIVNRLSWDEVFAHAHAHIAHITHIIHITHVTRTLSHIHTQTHRHTDTYMQVHVFVHIHRDVLGTRETLLYCPSSTCCWLFRLPPPCGTSPTAFRNVAFEMKHMFLRACACPVPYVKSFAHVPEGMNLSQPTLKFLNAFACPVPVVKPCRLCS